MIDPRNILQPWSEGSKPFINYLLSYFKITEIDKLYLHDDSQIVNELTVYKNNVIYMAMELNISGVTNLVASAPYILMYDENNVVASVHKDATGIFDTGTLTQLWSANDINITNIYFSRLFMNLYRYHRFSGYRITYTP